MVLCLSLIISPISWSPYYLLLLLPLGLYAGKRLPIKDDSGWLLVMVLSILCITPPVMFMGEDGALQGQLARVLLSHYLMGALLLWGLLAYARWQVAESHHLRLVSSARETRPLARMTNGHDPKEDEASSGQQRAG